MIILFINGYTIRWNGLFKEYQVREKNTGAGEDFKTIEEAIEHANYG